MEMKLLTLTLFEMAILIMEDFMKYFKLKDDTMNESGLQNFFMYLIHHRDSKITTDKLFINIDNGSMGGTPWTCFYSKDKADSMSHTGSAKKSFYFDSFGGQPDKFLLNHLPQPITYQNFKFQIKNSIICGSYCLHSFYLMERLENKDVT